MSVAAGLAIILFCVLVEGFFSGSEIALVSADKLVIRQRRKQGARSGELLARFLDDPESILTTTLIGTNICTVTSATVFSVLLRQNWGREETWITVVVLTPVILLFGELIPKSIYRRYATPIAQVVVFPLSFLSAGFGPVVKLVRAITLRLDKLLGDGDGRPGIVTREELRLMLDRGESEEIEPVEREMIDRIFDFSEVRVREVMRPLIDVVAVERESTIAEAVEKLKESGYSRLPVFAERVDDIVGVLWARDVLETEDLEVAVGAVARPVHYVAEYQKVADLLPDRRLKRSGLAVVVDEYGGAQGLVTAEDILEEIVGEIEDEHDDPEDDIRRRGEREYRVSARIEVDRLNEELGISIPDGDYETLGGFLLHRFGRIPRVAEGIEIDGVRVSVASATSRAIDEVDLVLPAPAGAGEPPSRP